jgi:hypothetical protein
MCRSERKPVGCCASIVSYGPVAIVMRRSAAGLPSELNEILRPPSRASIRPLDQPR